MTNYDLITDSGIKAVFDADRHEGYPDKTFVATMLTAGADEVIVKPETMARNTSYSVNKFNNVDLPAFV